MTSTELVNISSMDFESIAALTGAYVGSNSTYLPQLRINREPEDDEGNSLPMGAFYVSQNDTKVFGKNVTFRLFINAYQYQEYDPDTSKFINKSIIIKNFNEQALDELGGVACGKLSKDALERASESEKLRQRNIKCNRLMYGTVSFNDAHTATKNKVTLEDTPVVFKLAGINFMAPKEVLDSVTKLRRQYFQHYLIPSTKKEKNGSNVYYSVHFSVDLKNEIKWKEGEDVATFELFQDVIDRENKYVISKWNSIKKSKLSDLEDKAAFTALDLNDPLDDLLTA